MERNHCVFKINNHKKKLLWCIQLSGNYNEQNIKKKRVESSQTVIGTQDI